MVISTDNIHQYPLGTAVKRRTLDFFWHYGIVVDGGCVVSVYKQAGEQAGMIVCETLEEFAKGKQVLVARKFNQNPQTAYNYAVSVIGHPSNYRLLFNNCEHFVSRACGLNGHSVQAEIVGGATGAAMLYRMTKNPWLAALGFLLGAASMDLFSEKDNNTPAH